MQVGNSLQPYMAAQMPTQKTIKKPPCTTHSPFSDFFTREQAWSSGPEGYAITSSPYKRLSDSYDRWRIQITGEQDPMPDSKGLTDENLSYLKEHYSGELGWEERMDVLSTMQSMGILTENQRLKACGAEWAIAKDTLKDTSAARSAMNSQTLSVAHYSNPWERRWDVLFEGTPIAGFRNLNDILSWADEVRKMPPDEAELLLKRFVDLRG